MRHFVVADKLLKAEKSQTARADVEMRGQTEHHHQNGEVNVESVFDDGDHVQMTHDVRVRRIHFLRQVRHVTVQMDQAEKVEA